VTPGPTPPQAPEVAHQARSSPARIGFLEPPPPKQIPINLDTVLRLAQDQNVRVNLAREKVHEAFAGSALADKAWLPDLWLGTAYYRHEGGIQNPDGTVIHDSFGSLFAGVELRGQLDLRAAVFQKVDAERRLWQQKGELSRVTNEQLLDATSTYVDLLAAKAGEAISLEQEIYLRLLLARAEGIAKADPGLEVEVMRVRSVLDGQLQATRKLRESFRSGSAKMAYLLGMDPRADLVLMDRQMAAVTVVDPQLSRDQLIEQALASGPGVREMEGILNLINETNERNKGLAKFLPTFRFNVAEGAFGGGPGSRSDFDNRLDIYLSAFWNLTDAVTCRERQQVAQARVAQAHLTHKDIRDRLTMGVLDAYEVIQSGGDQMRTAENQMKHARAAYERSKSRLEMSIKGSSPSEVLFAIQSLGGAQLGYLSAIRDYDKAELRLLLLLGPACASHPHP
jgi:outer membrane protein TolC